VRRGQWVMVGVGSLAVSAALLALVQGRDVRPVAPSGRVSTSESPRSRLDAIGPRLFSNQTDQALALYGQGLPEGGRLVLSWGAERVELPTRRLDDGHAVAVVPEGLSVEPTRATEALTARLLDGDGDVLDGAPSLTVVNDARYPIPYAMEVTASGDRVLVASPTTDTLYDLDTASGAVRTVEVGDGPRALALWRDPGGDEQLLVVEEYETTLRVLPLSALSSGGRTIPVGRYAQAVAVDGATHRAYVTRKVEDDVLVVDLQTGGALGRYAVGVNPRAVALSPAGVLAVGNQGSSDLTLIEVATGQARRVAPDVDTEIAGGLTEAFAPYIMGGKASRDVAFSGRLGAFLVSSIGPDIGPNPKRMEVSMNSGVGVVDPASGRFGRHVSMLRGVGEGLAVDDARGVVYVADVGMGRVVAMDLTRMAGDLATARQSVVATVELPSPPGLRMREAAELGVQGRATESLYAGTRVVRLAARGERLFALNRLSGSVVEVGVGDVGQGRLSVVAVWPVVALDTQRQRRLGEVAFFTDLGNSRMSCDACHYEGHAEGVLFTKSRPMHIYRVPTLRAIRESPPYFTPALFPSLEVTSELVLGRNRYHNPDPNPREIAALSLYQATLTLPPNPYLTPDGAPPDTLTLPDGAIGHPTRGRALFDGKAACRTCHPPPHFTTDQDPATRRALHQVGTGVTLMVRPGMQDTAPYPLPPPSLLGAWDNFPLLHSGKAGFSEAARGQVEPTHPFALRRVLELARVSGGHGEVGALTVEEEDDLLAYLLTL